MSEFKTLYKRTATGAVNQWSVHVDKNIITTIWGQVGGKMQSSSVVVANGKNIGKKNETNTEQQALSEARSLWVNKIERERYTEDQSGERLSSAFVPPMLAQTLEKINKKHLVWGADLQRKYDGLRCIATCRDGVVTLWSRKGEPITSMGHINDAVGRVFAATNRKTMILDGELYNHDIPFQTLSGMIRSHDAGDLADKVEFHVYDLIEGGVTWSERLLVLRSLNWNKYVKMVETVGVENESDIMTYHDEWAREGYEGAILRQRHGLYESGKRSPYLAKIKVFEDAEFLIVGVKTGRGKFSDVPIFECETHSGKRFYCNAPGSMDQKNNYGEHNIGQYLTVKFFFGSLDGIPRFPVAKAIRED